MPAAGLPVASTMTSTAEAISAAESSSTQVLPVRTASSSVRAAHCSALQPTRANDSRARPTSKSAMPTMCIPGVRMPWDRNMEPNLPAPIRPTRTGRPLAARACSMVKRLMAWIP